MRKSVGTRAETSVHEHTNTCPPNLSDKRLETGCVAGFWSSWKFMALYFLSLLSVVSYVSFFGFCVMFSWVAHIQVKHGIVEVVGLRLVRQLGQLLTWPYLVGKILFSPISWWTHIFYVVKRCYIISNSERSIMPIHVLWNPTFRWWNIIAFWFHRWLSSLSSWVIDRGAMAKVQGNL